jgi:hypothetical protein
MWALEAADAATVPRAPPKEWNWPSATVEWAVDATLVDLPFVAAAVDLPEADAVADVPAADLPEADLPEADPAAAVPLAALAVPALLPEPKECQPGEVSCVAAWLSKDHDLDAAEVRPDADDACVPPKEPRFPEEPLRP